MSPSWIIAWRDFRASLLQPATHYFLAGFLAIAGVLFADRLLSFSDISELARERAASNPSVLEGLSLDAAVVAPQVDGVMLVVRAQQTTKESVEAALRQLRAVDAVMIGCVVNDVDVNSRTYGYGYHQYYRSESYAYTADPADAAG